MAGGRVTLKAPSLSPAPPPKTVNTSSLLFGHLWKCQSSFFFFFNKSLFLLNLQSITNLPSPVNIY